MQGDIRWIARTCRLVIDEERKQEGSRGGNRDDIERRKMEGQVRELAFYDEP
jgi:hypothetical protein